MVKRDYTTSGASRARRRQSPRKTAGIFEKSKSLLCLAVGLLLAFSAALYWLTQQQAVPLSRPSRQRLLAPILPSRPKERWRYIKALEDKKISVKPPATKVLPLPALAPLPEKTPMGYHSTKAPYQPLPPAAVATPRPLPDQRSQEAVKRSKPPSVPSTPLRWALQCGSFRGAEQAQSLRASLALLGIESDIRQDNGWQRVVVGPYPSREPVDNTLKRLKQSNLHPCILITP